VSSVPLTQFPRPSLAVDTATFTVTGRGLEIVLVTEDVGLALPGTFVHERERLEAAVLRSLRTKAGITGREPEQLHVFDDPDRDPRGWVVTVGHLDVVPGSVVAEGLRGGSITLVPVSEVGVDGGVQLPYDHPRVFVEALRRVRDAYSQHPDPWGLLPETFSLGDLQTLHEAVAGEELPRDTFRRSMKRQLEPTGDYTDGRRGRPSLLYRNRSAGHSHHG
jgi:ADP-ribose pyrophosphatase YjhB (NUDIX family)